MKRIGVTQRVVVVAHRGERRDALDQRWTPFLAACGLLSVPIPNHPPTAEALAEDLRLDGLLLTGGNSLVELGGDAPERDETERALVDWARHRRRPILGVCRGMQFVQRLFDVPLEHVPGHVCARQTVRIGDSVEVVNSYHEFGTRSSAGGLEVWAMAEDGVVEAVRHGSEPLTGIMWHPERIDPFRAQDVALFTRVFA